MRLHLSDLPPNDPKVSRGSAGHVDLWVFPYAEVADDSLWTAYAALLTPDEQARHDRFHFPRDRRQFLAARALVRTALSAYAPVAPVDWRFVPDTHGRPLIAAPDLVCPLHFNLSHTAGLIVCAVSPLLPAIGVDVETLDRRVAPCDLADRFFAPSEARSLHGLSDAETRTRFFTLWTLKESYVKARGLGLALGLDSFAFDLERVAPAIGFTPPPDDCTEGWQFVSIATSSGHQIAVSAATGGAPLTLSASRFIPPG